MSDQGVSGQRKGDQRGVVGVQSEEERLVRGGVSGQGAGVWSGGGCLVRGRVSGQGAGVWSGGGFLVRGRVSGQGAGVWSEAGGKWRQTPTRRDCYYRDRYASYWNAFLLQKFHSHPSLMHTASQVRTMTSPLTTLTTVRIGALRGPTVEDSWSTMEFVALWATAVRKGILGHTLGLRLF